MQGFRVSDFGVTPYKLFFFHLNNRHHSFAMIGSGRTGLHHFMVEMHSLDPARNLRRAEPLGHERLHLPEEQRARLRDMRLDAARRGVRAPVGVDCPWLASVGA